MQVIKSRLSVLNMGFITVLIDSKNVLILMIIDMKMLENNYFILTINYSNRAVFIELHSPCQELLL